MTARPSANPAARLSVRLTPRASTNTILRYAGGVLFLRLTAPPVEGAANAACCRYVADLLGIAPSLVSVQAGHKSRDKVLAIEGLTSNALESALAESIPDG
jgi:uncharacterized protein YggU (UPF0235/DUF167 family)